MLNCPHCGIRQYTAASYLELPRCVVCDGPLDLPKARAPRPTRRAPSLQRATARDTDAG
jgi:hypothetical protein